MVKKINLIVSTVYSISLILFETFMNFYWDDWGFFPLWIVDYLIALILLSAGVGITPMVSVAKYLTDVGSTRKVYFFHSSRNIKSLSFLDLIRELGKVNPYFREYITLTREPKETSWQGMRERLNIEKIKRFVGSREFKNAQVLVCGSSGFTRNMVNGLNEAGISKGKVRELSFGKLSKKKLRYFTIKEVAKHRYVHDAWIILGNKVFDITSYLNFHPGLDIINQHLGQDATEAFYALPHSNLAMKSLARNSKIQFLGYIK